MGFILDGSCGAGIGSVYRVSGRKPTLIGKAALALLLPLALSSCYSGSDKQPPASAWDKVPPRSVPTDHSSFFQQPFADGPSVTKACLECHPKSAEEVMATAHWNWVGDEVMVPGHDQPLRIGKRNLINNFCIGIKSNWPGCTQCHIGYGWEDESFDALTSFNGIWGGCEAAVEEAYRVLRPGGSIAITLSSRDGP